MSDAFYLPEEILEWVGLKKSEYLSELIGLMTPDDVPFEAFSAFDHHIQLTLSAPDWSVDQMEDGHKIKIFVRMYVETLSAYQVVIGVRIPDQEGQEVLVPILVFLTKKPELINHFTSGGISTRPILN